MCLRLARAKALQQFQALDSSILQSLQQLGRDIGSRSILSRVSDQSYRGHESASEQHNMTTSQHSMLTHQQTIMQKKRHSPDAAWHGPQAASHTALHPSPSSSISECCSMDRPSSASGGTKSAKRKAAEALLAARYNPSNISTSATGTIATAAVAAVHKASTGLPWIAAATAVCSPVEQLQSKRRKSSLTTAIDKLSGTVCTGAAAAAPTSTLAAAAESSSAVERGSRSKQQQLEKLQTVLQRLQGQHQHHVPLKPQQMEVLLPQEQNLLHDQAAKQQQQQQQQERLIQQQQQTEATGGASGTLYQQAVTLQAVYGAGPLAAVQQLQQQHFVQVPACRSKCKHSFEHGWCHTQVKLPHVDWGRVLDADLNGTPSFKIAAGYERLQMPEGLQVLIVENSVHLPHALQQLRSSMHDPFVAIDLEWRPEFGRRFTPVALMQLASSRVAVLVRTCRMNYRLPPVLKDFLKDPNIQLVGFSWGSSDEPKMQSTFGVGCKDFGRFMDLQQVAQGLGYCGFGLARLTKRVLGLNLPKSKKVSMSNWEAAAISRIQVKYAALDVLVAGQVFRALRLWHSSPSLCEVCHYNLGSADSTPSVYTCSCGKMYKDIKAYLTHCERASHPAKYAECTACGCTRPLPWPNSSNASSDGSAPGSSDSSKLGDTAVV